MRSSNSTDVCFRSQDWLQSVRRLMLVHRYLQQKCQVWNLLKFHYLRRQWSPRPSLVAKRAKIGVGSSLLASNNCTGHGIELRLEGLGNTTFLFVIGISVFLFSRRADRQNLSWVSEQGRVYCIFFGANCKAFKLKGQVSESNVSHAWLTIWDCR